MARWFRESPSVSHGLTTASFLDRLHRCFLLKAIFGAVTMNPMNRPAPQQEDLKVFISSRDSKCDECQEDLGPKAWITLAGNKGALCLSCADLDHLVFLPSGDAALTRRARKHSILSAVVLKWSGARKRYERQELLVEEAALQQAEIDCLADEEARAQRRLREAERRSVSSHVTECAEHSSHQVRKPFLLRLLCLST